ncbi:hypothetical protein HanRHA438_Chr06g0275541 [Helianthus annuus]|nr:hypothetical protein HanRHA438_Chr06g0275471 [Helianthus annuus]KAJ0912545.1 hypothetical protein HanRHA438_Chr06g0275541 [Helianthus annuus]
MALSRKSNADITIGDSFSTLGPSRIDPNAYVAASRDRQSGFDMLSCTKGITNGTIASPTVLATRPRHVPPAMARFQIPSS